MDGVIPLCVESCDHPEEVEDYIPNLFFRHISLTGLPAFSLERSADPAHGSFVLSL